MLDQSFRGSDRPGMVGKNESAPREGSTLEVRADSPLPRGWFAYSLGRYLNQLSWKLEQALFVGHGGWSALEKNYQAIRTRFEDLFAEPAAARLLKKAAKRLERWHAIVGSEDFADWADETVDHYIELAWIGVSDFNAEVHFSDRTGIGTATVESIRRAVLHEIHLDKYLRMSFLLGELVDRGVRPPENVKRECFDFHAPNPAYWARKRSADFVEESFRNQEQWQSYRKTLVLQIAEDDEDRPIPPPRRPSRPTLPRRTRLECVAYPCRRTALDLLWGPDVRIAWRALEMPCNPPRAVFAYHKKADFRAFGALLTKIDAAAMAGFCVLEGLNENRHAAMRTLGRPLDQTCHISTVGTALEPSSVRSPIAQSNPTITKPGSDQSQDPVVVAGSSVDGPHRGAQPGLRPAEEKPKKPRVTKDQRQRILRLYLQNHPDAKIARVAAETGVSTGAISEDQLWQEHLARRQARASSRGRERNVGSGKMAEFPAHTDVAAEAELREEIEQAYCDSCKAEDFEAYTRASERDKQTIREQYVTRCSHIINSYCNDSLDARAVETYNHILKNGDLKSIMFAANQITEMNND